MEYQLISMKKQLLMYMLKLMLGTVILGVGWLFFTNILIKMNIVVPANYNEKILNDNKERLLKTDVITDDDLPVGCKFIVVNLENDEKYGNMNAADVKRAMNVMAGVEQPLQGSCIYCVIPRIEDTCVVKYNMKAYLNIKNNKVQLIDYDILSTACMIIIYFLFAYAITLKLVNIWQKEFRKIEIMALEIENSNLDFEYSNSKIKEFNRVIKSIINMRTALRDSLFLNWKMENEKIEQIGALAHDIKIPLTIIKGNTELLLDYNGDSYNNSHLMSTLDAVQKIENYILLLIRYVRNENKGICEKKEMSTVFFSKLILQEITKYFTNTNTPFDVVNESMGGKIYIDYFSIERVILNIIDNAIQYKVANDTIICRMGQKNKKYVCSVSNVKGSFSDEVLLHATKLFYTSDKSRNSLHYGIGLAYAKRILQAHNGSLNMYNSKKYGATVRIELPLLDDKIVANKND